MYIITYIILKRNVKLPLIKSGQEIGLASRDTGEALDLLGELSGIRSNAEATAAGDTRADYKE